MKQFRFPLQPVMEWRERKADEEKAALERLHRTEAEIEASCAAVRVEMVELTNRLMHTGSIAAEQLHEFSRDRKQLDRLQSQLHDDKNRCRQQIHDQRDRCMEADRAHKLLEKMKERQHGVWKYNADREMEATASELYLAQWNRGTIRS